MTFAAALAFLLCLASTSAAVAADYLEVRRDATIYQEPNRRSTVVARITPRDVEGPYLARLIEATPVNGYYRVRLPARAEEGWIYKTFVRRSSARDVSRPSYRRSLYGSWIDEDGDCQDTRAEVLIRDDDDGIVDFGDRNQCRVARGTWLDPYTGWTLREARQLDVDHFVPLANAHDSGAWAWTRERRREYANYLRNLHHLLAVDASENRRKRDKGPDRYLPPRRAYQCEYVRTWERIKRAWELEMTEQETQAVQRVLANCP